MADPMLLIFVHGWSVTSTKTYAGLPEALAKNAADAGLNIEIRHIFLGRYISFHDEVTVNDLAVAMDHALRTDVPNNPNGQRRFSCVTHSTGGPVVRAWLDKFYGAERLHRAPLNQADRAWLLGVQRKLYRWSKETPEDAYGDVWNWVADPRNLRCAWQSIAQNKGNRTPGVDGLTVASIAASNGGVPLFLDEVREALRNGSYRPSPVRRKWIPKPGKPGKFRPLGIPTVADRVVQCAVKNILEPIFEARFWQVSYGFRPGRGCHAALEHIRMTIRPRRSRTSGQMRDPPYQWVIEGDIEGCFDNLGHHHLMERVRKSVADRKVNRLIVRFLKPGVLEDFIYSPTATGTPQGGVLSPLLANIALSAIEERYWKWTRHPHDPKYRSDGARRAIRQRYKDREAGRPVFYPVRYADDFLILVSGSFDDAAAEKQALADWLREEMGLTLSEEKTRITKLTEGFRFLGYRVRLKWDDRFGYRCRIEIPKEVVNDFRWRIKKVLDRRTHGRSLKSMLQEINPILRGWAYYYRYCIGAKHIL